MLPANVVVVAGQELRCLDAVGCCCCGLHLLAAAASPDNAVAAQDAVVAAAAAQAEVARSSDRHNTRRLPVASYS